MVVLSRVPKLNLSNYNQEMLLVFKRSYSQSLSFSSFVIDLFAMLVTVSLVHAVLYVGRLYGSKNIKFIPEQYFIYKIKHLN